MGDLIQYVELGLQANDDPIDWDHQSRDVVPAANRTRILDREAAHGIHPGADGWLTIPRPCGHWTDNNGDRVDVTHWTRIRWETLPHTDIQDLETP